MTHPTLARRAVLPLLAAPAILPRRALGQGRALWPSDKPVRIVVPLAAGGTSDFLARSLANRMQEATGQSFVVENRTGGAGAVGWQAGVRAAPDGTTLTVVDNALAISAAAGRDLGFDVRTDLEPLWLLALFAPIIVVAPNAPGRDLRGFVDHVKSRPDALFYGSNGIGSAVHLKTEVLLGVTGMRMGHVPYRGMAPATTDLIAGQIQMILPVFPTVSGQIRSGALRPLAVSATERVPALPDVPTAREAGVDFAEQTWFGLVLPRGTPPEMRAAMHASLTAATTEETFRRRLEELGATVPANAPDTFRTTFTRELDHWPRVMRDRGIRIE